MIKFSIYYHFSGFLWVNMHKCRQELITTAVGSMLAVGWMYTLPREARECMNKVGEERQSCKSTSNCMTFTTYFGTSFIWGQSLGMACVILVEVQTTGIYGRSEGLRRKKMCWIRPCVFCMRKHQPALLLFTCSPVHSGLHLKNPGCVPIQGLHPSKCALKGDDNSRVKDCLNWPEAKEHSKCTFKMCNTTNLSTQTSHLTNIFKTFFFFIENLWGWPALMQWLNQEIWRRRDCRTWLPAVKADVRIPWPHKVVPDTTWQL